MRIAVIGPGAIGLFIAYILENVGLQTTLVYRNRFRRLLAIKNSGPKVKVGVRTYELSAKSSFPSAAKREDPYDIVFIATKAYDFKKALYTALKLLRKDGLLASIQNGIGSLEEAEKVLGKDRVVAAVITYGVTRSDITTSELRGIGKIYMGQRTVEISPKVQQLAEILVKGGANVEVVDNIDSYRWLKVLVNAAIGPVTSVFNMENRVVLENRYAQELAISIVKEGVNIVNLMRISLPDNPVDEMLRVARKTAGNKSSMLQDILAGRETEINYINGAIVEYGRRYNISTPINETMTYIIRGLSKS